MLHEPARVGRCVSCGVVVEGHVEHRAAAAAHPAGRPCRASRGGDEVASHVGLEVDGEIVAARAPAPRRPEERAHAEPFAFACEPLRIERLDAVDVRYRTSQRSIPATDDQIDLRGWRERPDVAHGRERHHEVADALQAQQEDALRLRHCAGRRENGLATVDATASTASAVRTSARSPASGICSTKRLCLLKRDQPFRCHGRPITVRHLTCYHSSEDTGHWLTVSPETGPTVPLSRSTLP